MGLLKSIFTGVKNMLIGKARIEEVFDTNIVISSKMQDAGSLWASMYADTPPWKNENEGKLTLNLPKVICAEFARLATFESDISVGGSSKRAAYLNKQFKRFTKKLRVSVEKACSSSGVVLKPCVNNGKISVAVVQADNFYPTEFDSDGEVRGGIFLDFRYIGDYRYTRLEWHHFVGNTYAIENKAYKVGVSAVNDLNGMLLGRKCKLSDVPDWSDVEEEVRIDGVESVLFAPLKTPTANNIESESPLGVSIFSAAVDSIREADEQISRIIYEYKAKEVMIFAAKSAMTKDKHGKPTIPSGMERLLQIFNYEDSKDFYQVFSPEFRDTALFNGLNRILRNVEMQCGLAYGTISDVQDVEKTATEVITSKQRSYSTVTDLQANIQDALEQLLYAMDVLCSLYNLAPAGDYELSCSFGDGVMEDIGIEFTRRMTMVQAGMLRPELFVAWYFSCSVEDALEMMPETLEFDDMEPKKPPGIPEEE